jgi:hypothetical protein
MAQLEANDATLYGVSRLQAAWIDSLAEAVPYRLETLPYDVSNLNVAFDGEQLTLTHFRCDHEGTYFVSVYAPRRALTLEHKPVISADHGAPLALVAWRGVLWVPVEARIGFQSSDDTARPVSQEDIDNYAAR